MPLQFTDAIEEIEAAQASVTPSVLLEWAKQHAPEVAPLIEKDLTAGDVHVPSAGGTGTTTGPKKKPKTGEVSVAYAEQEEDDKAFKTFEYFLHCARTGQKPEPVDKLKVKHKTSIEADADELQALTALLEQQPELKEKLLGALGVKKTSMRTIRVMRHGATKLNNDDVSTDRIRGWKDIPLSADGREEAEKLAKKQAKDPPDTIISSDLKRAADTAKIVAEACGMEVAEVTKGLRPWNVGDYAGKTSKEAVPILCEYAIKTPDKPIPGGEPFSAFRNRFFNALNDAVQKYPDGLLAICTHHRGERLLAGWAAARYPADGSIDGKEFTKKGESTASAEDMELPLDKLASAAGTKQARWVNEPEDFSKIYVEDDGGAWEVDFEVMKAEPDKQLVFGFCSTTTKNGQPILDKQGDIIRTDDIEKAAYDFVLYSRTQGDMHERKGVGRLIESMIFTKEKEQAINQYLAEEGTGGSINLGLEGWWLGFRVDDPETWANIKAGNLPEFSIGGRGERKEI